MSCIIPGTHEQNSIYLLFHGLLIIQEKLVQGTCPTIIPQLSVPYVVNIGRFYCCDC